MAATSKPYHHGDLRRTLIETYLTLLREEEGLHFPLRELARRAGVSHTAAYKHFPDKASLLAEVAMVGFEQLREATSGAFGEGADEQRPRFLAMCHAYIRFSVAHPNLYRIMFSAEAREGANPQLKEKGLASLGVLVAAIERGHESGWLRRRDAFQQAHMLWAQLHGLAVLTLDGLIGPAGRVQAATEASLELLLEGLESADAAQRREAAMPSVRARPDKRRGSAA